MSRLQGRIGELAEMVQVAEDKNKVLEGENRELARMCKEKESELEQCREAYGKLISESNAERENLLKLQQDLAIAQNDRVNLQEELAKTLLLLETKAGLGPTPTPHKDPVFSKTKEAAEAKNKLEKRTAQLKEAHEAFSLLVWRMGT